MSLGDTIVWAIRRQQALPESFVAEISAVDYSASVPPVGEVRLKTGVSPDLIPVPLAGWSSTFLGRVQASGRALVGQQVIVLLVSGQPMILDTKES